MPSKSSPSLPLPEDTFAEMYNKNLNCFEIELIDEIPCFQLKKGQTLNACVKPPRKDDLIICPVPGSRHTAIVGKFLSKTGDRILMEPCTGIPTIIVAPFFLTVFSIS